MHSDRAARGHGGSSGGGERAAGQWQAYEPYVPAVGGPEAARAFYEVIRHRRTVREFSDRPVPRETIEWVIRAASTAPSGAHKQPWRFVAVGDAAVRHKIRLGAEEEERAFYGVDESGRPVEAGPGGRASRAGQQWLDDLAPFGTDADKGFLDVVPWIVVVFRLTRTDEGGRVYYPQESVGIATGLLLAAAHHAGLATLTHTPQPMNFLNELLGRPEHERPFLMVPMGYAAEGCRVPAIERKGLDEVSVFL